MYAVGALSNIMSSYKLMMFILPAEMATLSSPVTLVFQPTESVGLSSGVVHVI